MGLFLQVAIMPGCKKAEARTAVEEVAKKYSCSFDELESGDFTEEDLIISELIPDECQYAETAAGVSILFNDDCIGYDWGYELYDKGEILDRFNPMPDYFEEVSEEKIEQLKGDARIIAGQFHVEQASIERYLVRWSADTMDEKAYQDDEYGYEDWQMVDFMRKLGYPYDFDEVY